MGNNPLTAYEQGYIPQYPMNNNDYSITIFLDDPFKNCVAPGSPFSGRIILEVRTDTLVCQGFSLKITGKTTCYQTEYREDPPFLSILRQIASTQQQFSRGAYSFPFSATIPFGSPHTQRRDTLNRDPTAWDNKNTSLSYSLSTRYFLEALTVANTPQKANIGVSGAIELQVTTELYSLLADPETFGPLPIKVPRKWSSACFTGPPENIIIGVHIPGILTPGVACPVGLMIANNSRFTIRALEISVKDPRIKDGISNNTLLNMVVGYESLNAMGINVVPFSAPNSCIPNSTLPGSNADPSMSKYLLTDLVSMKFVFHINIPNTRYIMPGGHVLIIHAVINGPKLEVGKIVVGVQKPPVLLQLPPEGTKTKQLDGLQQTRLNFRNNPTMFDYMSKSLL